MSLHVPSNVSFSFSFVEGYSDLVSKNDGGNKCIFLSLYGEKLVDPSTGAQSRYPTIPPKKLTNPAIPPDIKANPAIEIKINFDRQNPHKISQ